MKKYLGILFLGVLFLVPALSFAQLSDIDPQGGASCVAITHNLRFSSRDANTSNDVSALQDFLNTNGYLKNTATGYFGSATLKAVKAFQKANNISPTGYVGPVTRAKIQVIDCGTTASTTNTSSSSTTVTQTCPAGSSYAGPLDGCVIFNTANTSNSTTDINLIKQTACGVSLSKTSNWSVVSNTSNETKLDIIPNPYTGFSGIDIKCVLGNTITDTDNKFGKITYFYDSSSQKWMVNSPDEQGIGMQTLPAVVAIPESTVSGFPVFRGTKRWLSYIIPISQSSILYLSEGDTEGGSTQSLTNLVNTLKKL